MRRVDCQGEYDGNLRVTSESVLIKGISVELMHDCRRELAKTLRKVQPELCTNSALVARRTVARCELHLEWCASVHPRDRISKDGARRKGQARTVGKITVRAYMKSIHQKIGRAHV